MNRDVVVDHPSLPLRRRRRAVLGNLRARLGEELGELALLFRRLGGHLDLRHGSRGESLAGDDAGAALLLRSPRRFGSRVLPLLLRLGLRVLPLLLRLGLVRGLLGGGGGLVRSFLFLLGALRRSIRLLGGELLPLRLGGIRREHSLHRRVPRAPPRVHLVQLSLLLPLGGRGGLGVLPRDGPREFVREPREFRVGALLLLQRPSQLELQRLLPHARSLRGGGATRRRALVLDVARE